MVSREVKNGIITILLVAASPSAAGSQAGDGAFRVLPRSGELKSCSISVVTGLAAGRHLLVRAQPRLGAPIVGRLASGEYIFACDESWDWHGNERIYWYGIVYGTADGRCRAGLPRSEGMTYTSACRSGWARRQWIEVLTG
jgi:hypothetical protein